MRKNFMLISWIFLFVISIFLGALGIGENNNTLKAIGIILTGVVSLINFIRKFNKWNEEK